MAAIVLCDHALRQRAIMDPEAFGVAIADLGSRIAEQ